jgi:hypothetical protein
MKTSKEILLQRHQAMESKLNAVRQKALAALDQPGLAQSWRMFVLSMRWHLAGLSAVWLAVLLLQIESAPGSTVVFARDKTPSARVFLTALLENRRELMELTETEIPSASAPAALPPRRSQIQMTTEIV